MNLYIHIYEYINIHAFKPTYMHRIICKYLDLRFFRMLWSHRKLSHPDLMVLDRETQVWAAFILPQHWPNGLLCCDFLLFCCLNENKFQYSACLKKKNPISHSRPLLEAFPSINYWAITSPTLVSCGYS